LDDPPSRATPDSPAPGLDYAGPRTDAPRDPADWTFRGVLSGLLVLGLVLFGGGLASLLAGEGQTYVLLLSAGSVLVFAAYFLRRRRG
jgi:hypothetical protein